MNDPIACVTVRHAQHLGRVQGSIDRCHVQYITQAPQVLKAMDSEIIVHF